MARVLLNAEGRTTCPDAMDVDDPLSPDAARRRLLSPVLSAEDFQPMASVVEVEFGAESRAGHGRQVNSDHYLVLRLARTQEVMATTLLASDMPERFEEHGYAMALADGAGAQGAGALASRVAISTLAHLAVHHGQWNLRVDAPTAQAIVEQAERYYKHVAHALNQQRTTDPLLGGMSTALTVVFTAGDSLFYAHVGHSRGYLFRDGSLTQFTRDRTASQRLEAQAPRTPSAGLRDLRLILSDVVGAGRDAPAVDVERIHLCDRDVILMCSNGVTSVLDDETIADVLAHPRRPADQCRQLIELVESRGGGEDATALIARYSIPSRGAKAPAGRK